MPPVAPPSIIRISSRTAITLLLFTLAFTALMATIYFATKDDIDASARAEKMKLIDEVLPKTFYDNDLLADNIALPPIPALGLADDSAVFRARKEGKPVALVIEAAAPDGYSGRIGLLLAVDADGRLIAMRVTDHKETPGLGDYIDPRKDKNKASPWIGQFNNKRLDEVPLDQWKVKKDGGIFDARAGATISARAVTNAGGRAMAWIAPRREQLFALPVNAKFEE
ncbi:MAG: electron transport complex subunit RsxG [Zoogloeaceae bacterium]|nr:electron transport complex subunit RsxG [Zoogloeaceae bacterium]